MEIFKNEKKRTLVPSDTATVHEYDTHDGFVSGAVAEIRGRYPAKGFVINTKIKELVYVLSGEGTVITVGGDDHVKAGDVVFVDHGEKFAWDGAMDLFIATTPSFDLNQYIEIE